MKRTASSEYFTLYSKSQAVIGNTIGHRIG